MRFTQINDQQQSHMLATIGVHEMEDLFSRVPSQFRLQDNLDIPLGISELELLRDTEALARRSANCSELTCFLGGGAYDHFIPTIVDSLAGQSELVTAYTPYQAEASQGILQLFYEFQTLVCQITGTEIANASLYDGATAVAEGVSMATAITGRNKVLVAQTVHPDIRSVLKTYAAPRGFELVLVGASNGIIDENELAKQLDGQTAALVVQSPNFFGAIERVDRLVAAAHQHLALAVVSMDPLSGGILRTPGSLDADIVVAEGQPLGIPLQYGGPYLGLMGCREAYLRKMPGRVVGMTRDREGRRAFCLALQTREQHIKRERATSNICTNQGLLAIRAAIYLAAMGQKGIHEVAAQCFEKSHYAALAIGHVSGYSLRFDAPFFKEFVVQTRRPGGVARVLAECRNEGILGGVPLGKFDKQYSDCFLVAVTEKRTRAEIDHLVSVLARM